MTPEQPSSLSGLLARKGAAMPLGLRRPQGAGDDEPEAKDAEAEAGSGARVAGTGGDEALGPVQLDLVSEIGGKEAQTQAEDPPPPASLLPFSLRRERREPGETWELVSSEIFNRMSGLAKGMPSAEPSTPAQAEVSEPEARDKEADDAAPAEGKAEIAAAEWILDLEDQTEPSEGSATDAAEPAQAEPEPSRPIEAEPDEPETAAPEGDEETVLATAPEPASRPIPAPPEEAGPVQGDRQVALGNVAADAIVKHAQPADVTPQAAAAPVADPAWRIAADKASTAEPVAAGRWILLGGAACLLIVGIAWWSYTTQSPETVAPPPAAGGETTPSPQGGSGPSADRGAPSAAEPVPAAAPADSG